MRIEEILASKGELIYYSEGTSMWPLLKKGRDVLIIKSTGPKTVLKKDDIVLYRKNEGHYILHRIYRVRKDGTLVLNGDHNWYREYDVKQDDVVGILIKIERRKKIIDLATDWKYHCYVKLYVHPFYLRAFFLLLLAIPKMLFHKLKKLICRPCRG